MGYIEFDGIRYWDHRYFVLIIKLIKLVTILNQN